MSRHMVLFYRDGIEIQVSDLKKENYSIKRFNEPSA